MNLEKKINFTFISKDFRKSESSSCKSISSGGRILSFRAFILMFCVTKKRERKKGSNPYDNRSRTEETGRKKLCCTRGSQPAKVATYHFLCSVCCQMVFLRFL